MQYKKCGKYDLKLSSLGLGCWKFGGGDYWGEISDKDAVNAVCAAVDCGINYFDTAEVYNDGRSESTLGLALKSVPRDKVVVGSKVSPSNAYAGELEEHCEDSLRRLDIDCIDLYMVHWPLNPYSLEHFTDNPEKIKNPPSMRETVTSLEKLKKAGKIRYYGVSNFGPMPMSKAAECSGQLTVNQLPYSLLTRAIEFDTIPYCQKEGIGIIGYITLMQGILTGKYEKFTEVPEMQRRTRHFDNGKNLKARHGGKGFEAKTQTALDRLFTIAEECGISIADLAIKWAVANPANTCAIVGSVNPDRIAKNVEAVSAPLTQELIDSLNSATNELKQVMGTSFDYYAPPNEDRTNL